MSRDPPVVDGMAVLAAGLGVVNTLMASVVERRGGPDGSVGCGDRNRCGLRDRGYHPYGLRR
ncbi:MAG: hypothetical protein ACC647_06825, partial [Anaerolineales bacterium]